MPVLAVTGGKGGTGKSTVAVNLAFALASQGLSVDLLDLDVECPNDSRISGLTLNEVSRVYKPVPSIDKEKCVGCGMCVQSCYPKALYMLNGKANLVEELCKGCMLCERVCPVNAITKEEKLVGRVSLGEIEVGPGRLRLLEGRLEVGEDESTRVIEEVFKHVQGDLVIVDTAAGTHCTVVRALRKASYAFIVTEPTRFGINDARKVASILEKMRVGYDFVLNRGPGQTPFRPRFVIPYSLELIESYTEEKPLVLSRPDSKEARVFMEMAEYARGVLLGNKAR